MPADPRTYITVHDGMPEHPKVVGLSDKAFRHLVELWCYCSRTLSNGKVPAPVWNRYTTTKTRQEIVGNLLAHETPDGVQMHDYLEHQRSKEQVEDLREKRRSAGAKGGHARAEHLANGQASAKASASGLLKQNGSKTQAESETDLLLRSKDSRPAEPDTFEAWWVTYPRKEGRGRAIPAYRAAVKRIDAAELLTLTRRWFTDRPDIERNFIPLPASWLNAQRWADERPVERPTGTSAWDRPAAGGAR